MDNQLKSEKSLSLHVNPTTLWTILTESKYTKAYMFNCAVDSEWKKGSSITWQGNFQGYEAYQKGEILDIRPYSLIKYSTFDPSFGLEDVPHNYIHVTYLITEEGGQSRLTILNETFDGNRERMDHIEEGWELVIEKIKETAQRAVLEA